MVEYKDTLNLPQTDFEMRAGLPVKEPRILARWQETGLYEAIQAARTQAPLFALHDGPPYANGTLHHGHILNKILKDIVIKDRTQAGFRVPYVPGWDCHGLPIEVQVDKELGAKKASMSKAEIHAACRAYAERFVDAQRQGFKRLGVLGRWEQPYRTMAFAYEAATLRELARLVQQGLVYKGLRCVNWCTVHQTALAEAEVEYEDHKSPSVYVAFAIRDAAGAQDLPAGADLVIWTTTPWTLPSNQAIAVHPELTYVAYPVRGRARIVAQALLPAFLKAIGEPDADPSKIQGTWLGKDLENVRYGHPFVEREGRVLLGGHVTTEAGTGCVHTAPAHGADDFDLCKRYGLEVISLVDSRGVLGEGAGPFAGLQVFAANPAITQYLHDRGSLLNAPDAQIVHRYPTCWRCQKPIIQRATEQWWVAMDAPYAGGGTLRERALAALKQVQWIPAWGEDRIRGMLAGRPDWCLSRQRTWGVPIAVAYCNKCDTPVLSPDHMEKVAQRFEKEGAAAWYQHTVEELFGRLICGACGSHDFRKESDILDVWFDSGTSYGAVMEREKLGHAEGPPADLYLEGSDQHRGWFHSSLLCSLATRERPPYRAVLTHGFVVDGAGKKISKSKGNYIDPFKAIDKDGAELLRLWVASEDYRDDIRLSQEILTRLADGYRKVRNTLRYLLGNLADFNPETDMLAPETLHELDAYGLVLLRGATERVLKGYASYNFHQVMQQITELCTVDLSAFYLDVLKDRLYASGKRSEARRSAQTVVYMLARDLIRLMAPVFCFTAEEAWTHLRRFSSDPDSVHLTLYPGMDEPPGVARLWAGLQDRAADLTKAYTDLREVRRTVNAALEEARRQKTLGSSMEGRVVVHAPAATLQALKRWDDPKLADLFIVSQVQRQLAAGNAISVDVARAAGTKCERCWLYREEVGRSTAHPTLCKRCVEAV